MKPEEPIAAGSARIGLHASADPAISEAEIRAFAAMRPGVIKLLSSNTPEGVSRLRDQHPGVDWIVRAFLDFGGRRVTPEQFVEWTLSDVQRALEILHGRSTFVELHNEPNLVAEGLGGSWADGAEFAEWWLDVLGRYRRALPTARFLYPGLSPGSSVQGVRQDHIQFIEASRRAVEAADALGVHVYWAANYPMQRALAVLDDYSVRFRGKALWITEASNNDRQIAFHQKAQEYLIFWKQLQQRAAVRGVTYFVASAANPTFAHEVWVGNGIAEIIGRR